MSPALKSLLIWAAVIIILAYLFNVNIGHLISQILNSAHQIHSSNGGH